MNNLIDDWMPEYDVRSHHKRLVRASPATVYDTVRTFDMSRSPVVAALTTLRGLPYLLGRRPQRPRLTATLDALLDSGFIQLAEQPGEQLLLGLIGRFWTPTGGVVRATPEQFAAFDCPGYSLVAWAFTVRPTVRGNTNLRTETRVRCTDNRSRTLFRAYWTVVGSFSGLIRHEALRLIKRQAELPSSSTGGQASA